jgi:hypothetical protein
VEQFAKTLRRTFSPQQKTGRKEFKTLQTNKILAFHLIIETIRNLLEG